MPLGNALIEFDRDDNMLLRYLWAYTGHDDRDSAPGHFFEANARLVLEANGWTKEEAKSIVGIA